MILVHSNYVLSISLAISLSFSLSFFCKSLFPKLSPPTDLYLPHLCTFSVVYGWLTNREHRTMGRTSNHPTKDRKSSQPKEIFKPSQGVSKNTLKINTIIVSRIEYNVNKDLTRRRFCESTLANTCLTQYKCITLW